MPRARPLPPGPEGAGEPEDQQVVQRRAARCRLEPAGEPITADATSPNANRSKKIGKFGGPWASAEQRRGDARAATAAPARGRPIQPTMRLAEVAAEDVLLARRLQRRGEQDHQQQPVGTTTPGPVTCRRRWPAPRPAGSPTTATPSATSASAEVTAGTASSAAARSTEDNQPTAAGAATDQHSQTTRIATISDRLRSAAATATSVEVQQREVRTTPVTSATRTSTIAGDAVDHGERAAARAAAATRPSPGRAWRAS